LSVHTGLEVIEAEDGSLSTEEEKNLTEDDVVRIVYNKKVRNRITKYIKQILSMRGVKDAENITANDTEVKELMKGWLKRQGKRHINGKERTRQSNIYIESVARKHRPHYFLAIFQLFSWAILYDDIFSIISGQIDCRLNVDIPDAYWEQKLESEEDVDTDLDNLLGDNYSPPELQFDKSNPIEIMLAIITEFLNNHEQFGEELRELFNKMFTSIAIINGNSEFDDAGFLNTELDKLLSGDDGEGDIAIE